MVMRIAVAGERNRNLRIDTGSPHPREVWAGVKNDAIRAGVSVARQVAATAIGIGDAGSNFNPIAGRVMCAFGVAVR